MLIIAAATPSLAILIWIGLGGGILSGGANIDRGMRIRLAILALAGPLNLAAWLGLNEWLDTIGWRSIIGYVLAAAVFITAGAGAGFLGRALRTGNADSRSSATDQHDDVKSKEPH